MHKQYDYLIVGAGLFGAVAANRLQEHGKTCLLIDKRGHVAGNAHTALVDSIPVHAYGPHIFHTSNQRVWDFVQQFTDFLPFINSPLAIYRGQVYNLPFNMNTFNKLWGVITPEEARRKISRQVEQSGITQPQNLEEQAISLVGKDVYEILIKGYTQKQWGAECTQLPAFIIKRLPVRFTYDNNYFNDRYQGIPADGYTTMVQNMIGDIELRLNTDYFADRAYFDALADRVIFTGMIDQYYDYAFGELAYRSLRFELETLDILDYQGNAVVNYTDTRPDYTRIIEHKHFVKGRQPNTVITREYPMPWTKGDEPYYPVNNARNDAIYQKYAAKAKTEPRVFFGGRLGEYKYYNMDQVVLKALELTDAILGGSAGAHR